MRKSNRAEKLAEVARWTRDRESTSRPELCRELRLSAPKLAGMVRDLLRHGVLMEDGHAASSGGRRPARLRINPDYAWAIGAELSQNRVRAAAVDLHGRILRRQDAPYPRRQSHEALLESVRTLVDGLTDAGPEDRLIGLGVGISGIADRSRGVSVSFPAISSWQDIPLAQTLAGETGRHVQIQNLVRAATLGEMRYGRARSLRNFIYVHLGRGLGLGMVVDGRVVEGASHRAGEFGHMVIEEDGPVCYCGNYGCLESVASLWAMVEQAKEAVSKGVRSRLDSLNADTEFSTAVSAVFQAAVQGDRLAQNLIERTSRYLGTAVANVVNLLNPEAVILGGALADVASGMQESLCSQVRARVLPGARQPVQFLPAALGEDAYCLGAAALEFDALLEGTDKLLRRKL